ncbi:MAG: ubiquinol-cytochrome c reductase iron-sulfur subunit [Ktedonobacterales bacterium]
MSTYDETPIEPGSELPHEPDRLGDTGSVERYVRLHGFVEQLLQDTRHHSSAEPLPDEDAEAYHMAAFLRAAAPAAGDPDPDFVSDLQSRLFAESGSRSMAASPSPAILSQPRGAAESPTRPTMPRPVKPALSRRMLLGAGFGAAAAVGVAAGVQIEHLSSSTPPADEAALVPSGTGAWVAVAAAQSIPIGHVQRFETDFVIGFVRHTPVGFAALSGTCTHMGCLLLWNAGDRTFDCPCHGGRFTEQGDSAPGSPFTYKPLPSIQTKVENGQIWVYVVVPPKQTPPTSTSGATSGTPDDSGSGTYSK